MATYDEMNEREVLAAIAENLDDLTREVRDASRRLAATIAVIWCDDHNVERVLERTERQVVANRERKHVASAPSAGAPGTALDTAPLTAVLASQREDAPA